MITTITSYPWQGSYTTTAVPGYTVTTGTSTGNSMQQQLHTARRELQLYRRAFPVLVGLYVLAMAFAVVGWVR